MIKKQSPTPTQRTILLLFLLILAAAAHAVPAKPGLTRLLTLTNGNTLTATLIGDEYAHYWLAADGNTYQALPGTDLFYAVNPQTIIQRAQQRRAQANHRRAMRLAPRRTATTQAISGNKKGLIILVNFSDKTFNPANNNALYQRIANEENFTHGNFKGSIYDYFKAQSQGQFLLTFDVVGPVTLSQKTSYYGSNDSQGNDKHPAEMVIEALNLADPHVNFADYDWDGDGEVDQVYLVYAGKGEADGGAANTIWPHEWILSEAAQYDDGTGIQTLDGVRIDTYACSAELDGITGSIAGIGTACHEFSHCLGYPDFYDTDYSGGQGMFEWDLMDTGSYNGGGYLPAGYTSYERWMAGWITPIELVNTQTISNMPALQAGGSNAYIIYNKGNQNEYFLLENRQQTGWDAGIPASGLLIIHVDYDPTAWASNTPNDNPNHQRMTWIAADNEYQYEMYQGTKYFTTEGAANDTYPYGPNNSFSKTSTPAAKLFNKNADGTYYLDSSVEDITQNSDGTVSFSFVGISNVATPVFSPKAGRYDDAQTVTISCDTEGATIYYTLDGTNPTQASSLYTQALTISETTTVKAVAIKDGEPSAVATAKYSIGPSASNPNTTTFKLVASTDDLEPGMRYIIACASKNTAAGALNSTYLNKVDVTSSNNVITTTSDVAVFVLEGNQDSGWTLQNETTNEYLYATETKKLAYSQDESTWTLKDGTAGVTLTYGSYGTMLYNVNSPRFTTYTSNPSASMIQASLYMEYSDGGTTPVTKQDVTMEFSPAAATATIGEAFTQPTLTMDPPGMTVTYSSSAPAVATVDENTGEVTLVAAGTTIITATFAGNDSYNSGSASYTLTVTEKSEPAEGILLYEGLTKYASENDANSELKINSDKLDYSGWASMSKIFAGGTNNAHSNGGCLKFGSGTAVGSMTTGSIKLTDDGKLTFYLKQYKNDSGLLNLTVTGATADVTTFTPASEWTLCTVNLTNATGNVTITLATTEKRAYIDEITLTANPTTVGITTASSTNAPTNNDWYDLNGRRLQAEPTAKGIYIVNGRKVVVQ